METYDDIQDFDQEILRAYRKAKKASAYLTDVSKFLNAPIQLESSKTGSLACKKGCAHCCYLRVVAYTFEVVSIYFLLVNKLRGNALQSFKDRLSEQRELIRPMSHDQHLATNVRCPMLVNDACITWPVRPIACSGHHSMSELACRDSYENPEVIGTEGGGIPMVIKIKEIQLLQQSFAEAILDHEHDDKNQYELIAALHALFENPKLLKRWRDGKKTFMFNAG